MSRIYLNELYRSEILSRNNIIKLRDKITGGEEIDFQGIIFISRSVADELINLSIEFPNLVFNNVCEEISQMLEIVRKGRTELRNRKTNNRISMMIYCKNMEEVKRALGSAG